MFTPKRPDAICLIFERRSSPKRTGSSPPSPVFERPPMRFIATASVSCASRDSEPRDIAPVEKRLTISAAGSTPSSGIPPCARVPQERSLGELGEPDPPDARRRTGEVLVDQLGREPDRLEDLGAAVRRDRRDAHLRDRLQEALADRLDGARLGLLLLELQPPV